MSPVLLIADVFEDLGCDGDPPPGNKLRHPDFIGLPNQRKTSSSDFSVKDRSQHGMEAKGAQSSFYNAERSGSASLKG